LTTNKYELYSNDFQNLKCVVFTEYQGLNSEEISELRKNMRSLKVRYRVVKNTLASIIFKQNQLDGLVDNLKGPTAVAIIGSPDDLIPVSKNLVQFAKEHKNFKIKSGFISNKKLSIKDLVEISSLPGKDALVAKMIGTLKMPLFNIVNTLSAPSRKLVCTVAQIKAK